jgi:hypothetical protein
VKNRATRDKALEWYFSVPLMNNHSHNLQSLQNLCLWCASADKHLDETHLKRVKKLVPFSKGTFSKYSKIGNSPRVLDYGSNLPVCFTLWYELAKLDDKALDKMVQARLINPKLTRATIIEFSKKKKEPNTKAPEENTEAPEEIDDESVGNEEDESAADGCVFASIFVSASATDEALAALQAGLDELEKIEGVSLEYEDPEA